MRPIFRMRSAAGPYGLQRPIVAAPADVSHLGKGRLAGRWGCRSALSQFWCRGVHFRFGEERQVLFAVCGGAVVDDHPFFHSAFAHDQQLCLLVRDETGHRLRREFHNDSFGLGEGEDLAFRCEVGRSEFRGYHDVW